MGLFDWIKKGVSFLAPHAGKLVGWGAQKLGGWAMRRMEDAAANYSSVFGKFIRNYGPYVAEWMGTKPFQETMRKFGSTIDNTTVGRLIRFPDGMSAGSAMLEANNRMMNFLKNGGRAPTNNIAVDRQIESGALVTDGGKASDAQMTDGSGGGGVQPERQTPLLISGSGGTAANDTAMY